MSCAPLFSVVKSALTPDGEAIPADRRERILFEASRLFARFGYHGTSTRDIAQAVGIRQPSLFHHFASKSAIMDELLALNYGRAVAFAEAMRKAPGSPAARFYRLLLADLVHVSSVPFDLSSTLRDEVLEDPEFEPWLTKQRRLYRAVRSLAEQGREAGELQDFNPRMIEFAIVAVFNEVIRCIARHATHDSVPSPEEAAAFMMRSILRDPESLEEIVAEADSLAAADSLEY